MLSIEEISNRLQLLDISIAAREAGVSYNTVKALRGGQRGAHGKTIEKLTAYLTGSTTPQAE